MPSRVWSHVCNYATQGRGGMVSIIEEFDTIGFPSMPAHYPFFQVASKWEGSEDESFVYGVRVTTPHRAVLYEVPGQAVTIRKHVAFAQPASFLVSGFAGALFPEFGEYAVELLIDNLPVHILPLYILQIHTA